MYSNLPQLMPNNTQQMSPMTNKDNSVFSWFSNMFKAPELPKLPSGVQPNTPAATDFYTNEILKQQLADMQGFDWGSALNTGLGVANFAMQIPQYQAYNDYMNKSIQSMENNMKYAEDEYQNRQKTRENYGSAFSNAQYQ